ncbi:hypothetical protein BOX15_Mlig030896g2 [Macrostomum lignano]|uniref:RNA-binding protein 5 n=1 Tax=Macrostomum lignano TaxID=282301 RepID=A0A267FVK3_9PLAT|nr:hypothetical protein BOX15_Mlig030896g2 [Macrostomum lignano]
MPRSESRRLDDARSDWMCLRCNGHNFRKREACYKCGASRAESCASLASDGSELVSSGMPCNTLVLRNLDALTTEESVAAFAEQMVSAKPKNACILRDPLTRSSKCCALIEFDSVTDSMQLVQMTREMDIVELDGKAINIDYAKHTYKTIMGDSAAAAAAAAAVAAAAAAGASSSTIVAPPQPSTTISTTDSSSAAAVAACVAAASAASAAAVAAVGVPLMSLATTPTSLLLTSAAPGLLAAMSAVPSHHLLQAHHQALHQQQQQQQAVQHLQLMAHIQQHQRQQLQLQQLQQLQMQQQQQLQQPPATAAEAKPQPKQPQPPVLNQPCQAPDTSKLVKEPTSGYYYDSDTGLYYDANTQYFFDPSRSGYLYWDSEAGCYRDANELQKQLQEQQQDGNKKDASNSKEAKPSKQQTSASAVASEPFGKASSIQKDMERWARMVNKQKNKSKQQAMPAAMEQQILQQQQQQSGAADTAFAMLTQMSSTAAKQSSSSAAAAPAAAPAIAPPVLSAVAAASLEEEEEKLLDWTRLACLLCQRGFQSEEALRKHKELSQLHRTNLEQLSERLGLPPLQQQQLMDLPGSGGGMSYEYRDRAKERREKYGLPPPPATGRRRPPQEQQQQRHQAAASSIPQPPQPQQQPQQQPPQPAAEDSGGVGKKLLKKMGGWREGQGLGRLGQGRVAPVEAEVRRPGVGLGVASASTGTVGSAAVSGSYMDKVKSSMMARYQEFDE